MKKFKYLFRKLFTLIIILLIILLFIVIYTNRNATWDKEPGIKALTVIFLGLIVLSSYIYPSRTKYCNCGRKYTSTKYEYIQTLTGQKKKKDNIQTTPYQYEINVVYFCEHCNKEYRSKKYLDGGMIIDHLNDGTYEDKKITYDEALEKFKNSQKKKKK